jgi:hypothetical protein
MNEISPQSPAAKCAELKPCPFCGGAFIKTHPKMSGQWPSTSQPKLEELTQGGWRVTCYGCGIGTWNNLKYSREETIQVWNTRHFPEPPADEGLEEIAERLITKLNSPFLHRHEHARVILSAMQQAVAKVTKERDEYIEKTCKIQEKYNNQSISIDAKNDYLRTLNHAPFCGQSHMMYEKNSGPCNCGLDKALQ